MGSAWFFLNVLRITRAHLTALPSPEKAADKLVHWEISLQKKEPGHDVSVSGENIMPQEAVCLSVRLITSHAIPNFHPRNLAMSSFQA